ncbi:MAG: response regulator, partial [Pirellulales bacterium]
MVADNELPSRRYVCELIKEDPRFRIVAICDSGQSVVAEAQKLQPDTVFLDIQMPRMDSFEVVEVIQDNSPLVPNQANKERKFYLFLESSLMRTEIVWHRVSPLCSLENNWSVMRMG